MANFRNQSGNRPIVLATQPLADFAKQFRAIKPGKPADGNQFLANVDMPLYTGLDIDPGDGTIGHGQVPAATPINFGKMAKMEPALQEAILAHHGVAEENQGKLMEGQTSGYTGNTAIEGLDPESAGAPVATDARYNVSTETVTVRTIIDPSALARANYEERLAARKASPDKFKGARPLPEIEAGKPLPFDAQRLPISVKYPTATNGIGSVNKGRVAENVARAASQSYLLTASKANPGKNLPSKGEIDSVAGGVSACLDEIVAMGAKGCKGIPVRDKSGQPTGATVPNTEFPSFAAMGIKAVTDKDTGSTFLVVADETKAAQRAEGLPKMANALNARMSQTFAGMDSKNARNLGLSLKFDMYEQKPQNLEGMNVTNSVISPAMRMEITPFASAVRDSVECAQHKHDSPELREKMGVKSDLTATIDTIYGKEILDNTKKILSDAGIETDAKALGTKTTQAERESAKDASCKLAERIGIATPEEGMQEQMGQ